jgi:hypothetical protein
MILVAAEILCFKLKLYATHTIYIIILNGMFFGLMTSKLIVCNMAKKKIETFNWDNLLFLLIVIICIMADSLKLEVILISICAFILIYKYFSFWYTITKQLLNYLNISF